MAEAKRNHDWNQTALLAVLIAEPNRDKKLRNAPFTEADFHPGLRGKRKGQKRPASYFFEKESAPGIGPVQTVTEADSWAQTVQT